MSRPIAGADRASPIRICYVIGTLDIGGAEKHLVEVAGRLDHSRFDTQVCVLSEGGPLQAEIEALGAPVRVAGFRGLRSRRDPLAPFVAARHLLGLVRFFRQERFDIVHAYLFWAYVLAAPAARLARVPVVIESRRSLGLFKADKPHYLWLERLTNGFADMFVPNSEGVKADVMRGERIPEQKLRVIYNGVDADRYRVTIDAAAKRVELGLPASGAIVVVVANLIDYKGHKYLLEAVARIAERHPGLRVLLVGIGPMQAEIEATATSLGIDEHIVLLGQRTDVPELLALADVSVLPSLQEGFSNTLLESMAAGKAIVATAVGGNPEAIVDGESGLLVPPADAEALAGAIDRLLGDSALRQRLGEAARKRAVERFSMEAMIDRMTETYEDLLRQKGRA